MVAKTYMQLRNTTICQQERRYFENTKNWNSRCERACRIGWPDLDGAGGWLFPLSGRELHAQPNPMDLARGDDDFSGGCRDRGGAEVVTVTSIGAIFLYHDRGVADCSRRQQQRVHVHLMLPTFLSQAHL
jgi:hypothetical protein